MQYIQLSRRSASSKIDWEKQYLTFIPMEDAVFSWIERAVSGHLEYSVNGGQTWVTIANGESTPTITAGSKIMWRGNLVPYDNHSSGGIGTFSATSIYNACGNVMSLLFYDDYYGSILSEKNSFRSLFENDTNILTPPILPSKSLKGYCYSRMFKGCKSLMTAPNLPAKTVSVGCYHSMFYNCCSLIVAPELPAKTILYESYRMMFKECTKLNYVKCLATTINSGGNDSWLNNVASTGTFVKAAGMEDWPTGASGIPSGWTVVTDNS